MGVLNSFYYVGQILASGIAVSPPLPGLADDHEGPAAIVLNTAEFCVDSIRKDG